jgi:acetoin utilization deacetylase AcuC-like enzyme
MSTTEPQSAHGTVLFRSDAFTRHDTGTHPENPRRMLAIERELIRRGLLVDRPVVPFAMAALAEIARVHDPGMLAALESIAGQGGGWIDSDTVVRPESVDVVRLAAGAGIAAVDTVLANQALRGFVLARPPGHHATPSRPMGFCLLNTIAIAAAHALAAGTAKVAILDWDVHHGNGTQEIFYDNGDVLFCSLHQSSFYPGSGSRHETGHGAGAGTTLNIPLRAGSGDAEYRAHLESTIAPAIMDFKPDLLLISAGYDAHADDPLGGMKVTDEGFRQMATFAVGLAETVCEGRVIAVLEGGYDPQALARCVADAIEVFDGPMSAPALPSDQTVSS